MVKNNTFSDTDNILNVYFYDKRFLSDIYVFKDRSDVFKIAMSVFFVVSMMLSVVGNVCTCAVIIRDRSMRTPTNYYLFNLAVADLTTAMFIPIEITVLWIPDLFGKITGHIAFLFWDLLCNCSALTILALTVERYIVISKPFLRHTFVQNSRVFKILVANWAIATSFGVVNIFYIYNIEDHTDVYIYFDLQPSGHVVLIMAAEVIIFFILPMFVITMIYALITLKLKTKQTLKHSPVFAKQNRSKAIKLLAAVTASFFICWSPYCIIRIMAIVPKLREKDYINKVPPPDLQFVPGSKLTFKLMGVYSVACARFIDEDLNYWQIFCYLNCINSYASTAVNPILYSLMSRKFRRAFKDLLKGRNILSQRTSPNQRASFKSNPHEPAVASLRLNHIHTGNFNFD